MILCSVLPQRDADSARVSENSRNLPLLFVSLAWREHSQMAWHREPCTGGHSRRPRGPAVSASSTHDIRTKNEPIRQVRIGLHYSPQYYHSERADAFEKRGPERSEHRLFSPSYPSTRPIVKIFDLRYHRSSSGAWLYRTEFSRTSATGRRRSSRAPLQLRCEARVNDTPIGSPTFPFASFGICDAPPAAPILSDRLPFCSLAGFFGLAFLPSHATSHVSLFASSRTPSFRFHLLC